MSIKGHWNSPKSPGLGLQWTASLILSVLQPWAISESDIYASSHIPHLILCFSHFCHFYVLITFSMWLFNLQYGFYYYYSISCNFLFLCSQRYRHVVLLFLIQWGHLVFPHETLFHHYGETTFYHKRSHLKYNHFFPLRAASCSDL